MIVLLWRHKSFGDRKDLLQGTQVRLLLPLFTLCPSHTSFEELEGLRHDGISILVLNWVIKTYKLWLKKFPVAQLRLCGIQFSVCLSLIGDEILGPDEESGNLPKIGPLFPKSF